MSSSANTIRSVATWSSAALRLRDRPCPSRCRTCRSPRWRRCFGRLGASAACTTIRYTRRAAGSGRDIPASPAPVVAMATVRSVFLSGKRPTTHKAMITRIFNHRQYFLQVTQIRSIPGLLWMMHRSQKLNVVRQIAQTQIQRDLDHITFPEIPCHPALVTGRIPSPHSLRRGRAIHQSGVQHQDVMRRLEIQDHVTVIPPSKDELILQAPAPDRIVSRPSLDHIQTLGAKDHIVARPTAKRVVSRRTIETIIARTALKHIRSQVAERVVISVTAIKEIKPEPARQRIVPGP